jgi:hypothetical protein
MVGVQKELAVVLNRANERHVEAALAAFALLRLARELFNKYPPAARDMLIEQMAVPFLQGEPAEEERSRFLIQ